MKNLVIIAIIIVMSLISQSYAQETEQKISVEIYYNAKSKQVQDIVAQLIDGLRFKDKLNIIHYDVSSSPDYAMLVNGMVKGLPENLQSLIDVIMVIDKDIELYGSRHIQQFMNQAILNKMGMKVDKPASYTPLPVQVNPLDEVNLKLNIILVFCCLFYLNGTRKWFWKRKRLKECEKIAKNEVLNETQSKKPSSYSEVADAEL